jgi:hypothetical protein
MVVANQVVSQTFEPSRLSLDDKIGFLSTPESWPGRTRRISVLQTHHAWLFMTDRYVYKMKKPFRAGGMNFSSLESRHRLCLDEYRLNRQLAAHTYLGVVPMVLTKTGNLAVDEEGTIVEWLVKMRRLPESRMLTALATDDRLTNAHVTDFIRKLSQFHELAPACRFEPGAYGKRLQDHLDSWHRELSRCEIGWSKPLPGLAAAQLKYLDVYSELLESRQREGHVRNVHGDLRPEHVFILEKRRTADHRLPGIRRRTQAARRGRGTRLLHDGMPPCRVHAPGRALHPRVSQVSAWSPGTRTSHGLLRLARGYGTGRADGVALAGAAGLRRMARAGSCVPRGCAALHRESEINARLLRAGIQLVKAFGEQSGYAE